MMLNFAGNSSTGAAAVNAAQRRVTKLISEDPRYIEISRRDPSVQLMVSQVACFDEGCVPLETLIIAVSTSSRWMGKLLMPVAEVEARHVAEDLNLPSNWWLYSRLQALRMSKASKEAAGAKEEEGGNSITQSEVEAAYAWLMRNCSGKTAEGGSVGLLAKLEAQEVDVNRDVENEDEMTASRALSLLAMAIALPTATFASPSTTEGAQVGFMHIPAGLGDSGDKKDEGKENEAAEKVVSATPSALQSTAESKPPAPMYFTKAYAPPPASAFADSSAPPVRHDKSKGVRQRGCPCCDPESIDSYVDKVFMSNI